MLRALFTALSAAVLAGSLFARPAAEFQDPDLEQGVALVKEGDFEAAVLKLDEAARRLSAGPRSDKELAAAYLYLGIAYLELDQELSARARFKDAAALDRELRLDPRAFSPQVIRFFDAARQEVEATSKAAAASESRPKRRVAALPLAVAGGAAAAGIAIAGSGGGAGGPATTLAPTTTTLPPPGAACAYTVAGAEPPSFPAGGGSGTCPVVTSRPGCEWSAESTESWIEITGGAGGHGNGVVRFTVAANPGGARSGRIRLDQDHAARCEIAQTAGGNAALQRTGVTMQAALDVPAGQGQLVVNGSAAFFQQGGRLPAPVEARPGPNRVEAILIRAQSRPGSWRFEMNGAFEPGSFRVIAGDVTLLTAETIVFRLAGKPGERVAFSFRGRQ